MSTDKCFKGKKETPARKRVREDSIWDASSMYWSGGQGKKGWNKFRDQRIGGNYEVWKEARRTRHYFESDWIIGVDIWGNEGETNGNEVDEKRKWWNTVSVGLDGWMGSSISSPVLEFCFTLETYNEWNEEEIWFTEEVNEKKVIRHKMEVALGQTRRKRELIYGQEKERKGKRVMKWTCTCVTNTAFQPQPPFLYFLKRMSLHQYEIHSASYVVCYYSFVQGTKQFHTRQEKEVLMNHFPHVDFDYSSWEYPFYAAFTPHSLESRSTQLLFLPTEILWQNDSLPYLQNISFASSCLISIATLLYVKCIFTGISKPVTHRLWVR